MPPFKELKEKLLSSQPRHRPNPNTPLGRPKRKKEETQNFTSPLNDRDNPSPKRMRIIPPSTHPVIPHPNPHPLIAGHRMSHSPLPPINLKDYGVNTYVPAQQQYEPHRIYACASCGSKEARTSANPGSYKDVPKEIQKTKIILAALCQQNLTISQFLATILDPNNEDKLTSNSQSSLATFLQGWTTTGTQPIDTVKLMFHHRLSQDRLNQTGTAYHPLPIYARPPTILSLHPQSIPSSLDVTLDGTDNPGFNTRSIWDGVRARSSLKQYFLHKVLEEVSSEVENLVEEGSLHAEGPAVLSWINMTTFSFTQTQELILKKAPVLWSILTMAAISDGNAGRLLAV